ncbi:hypothetical protein [Burkholderia vietnamiensis]|uniref:hypothetical protein n=1 Tax=Burkholderia vietnamiensis TaxID=60552 RepID=UPI001D13E54C|nr:hypothetical protein [Burkholderia vietnamiensis]
MRNPRPVCPNPDCVHHTKPPADFYRKNGYRRTKHNGQPVPRYQCKACGKNFCATQVKPIHGQHRPDLNTQVFKMAVSRVGIRRMATVLGCGRETIQRKIEYLAGESRRHHALFLLQLAKDGGTGYVMMDELETYIHARWAQVGVPMAVRVKTGHVLGFGIALLSSNMKKGRLAGWTKDTRHLVVPKVLNALRPVMKPGGTLATDGDASYPKWIARALPGVRHERRATGEPGEFDPLFTINLTHAKLRNDLARLGRRSWATTKTMKALDDHLWLWVAWVNGYPLK